MVSNASFFSISQMTKSSLYKSKFSCFYIFVIDYLIVFIQSNGDYNKAMDCLMALEVKAFEVNDEDMLMVLNDSDDSDEETEQQ